MRMRRPSDDKLSPFDIGMLVVALVVIAVLVAWAVGWL